MYTRQNESILLPLVLEMSLFLLLVFNIHDTLSILVVRLLNPSVEDEDDDDNDDDDDDDDDDDGGDGDDDEGDKEDEEEKDNKSVSKVSPATVRVDNKTKEQKR